MTLAQKLADAKKEWEVTSNYNRDALPEVYQYNLAYRKDNPEAYGYNASILEYILKQESIPEELHDHLNTEVYLSQQQLTREKEQKYHLTMVAEGWIKLDKQAMELALEAKKNLTVKATMQSDWLTSKIEEVYKPFIGKDGAYVLMKPRARRRGFYLSRFENAYCKLI